MSSSAISSQPRRPVGRPKKELSTAGEPQQQLLLSAVEQTVLDGANLESADEAAQPMGVMMQVKELKVIRKLFLKHNKSFRWHLGDYEKHNFFPFEGL